MALHIVHERRSDANTSVAAIDTMAGRGSARKGAVVHDAKDFWFFRFKVRGLGFLTVLS